MRVGAAFAFALACSTPAPVERARQPSVHTPTIASAAPSAEPATEDAPPARAPVRLELVLAGEAREELDWEVAAIREGLLIVPGDAPRRAQLLRPDGALTPLPDLFKGLRFKAGGKDGWNVDDFRVSNVRGLLDRLSFSIDVSSSGFMNRVEGRTGRFSIEPHAPEPLYGDPLVALPVTTPKGARLYEVVPGSADEPGFGQALHGARFAFDGPSRGERLPLPRPGDDGCRTKLLGHPFLAYLSDGALIGVGNVCSSREDRIPLASVRGSGLYASGAAMLGQGALAVELFRDGVSTVTLLPGAADPLPESHVELRALPEGRALLVATVRAEQGVRPYVALFDGASWRDMSPAGVAVSELGMASVHVAASGVIHLFWEGEVFRSSAAAPFKKLLLKLPASCAELFVFARPLARWAGGALLFGTSRCLFVAGPDESFARLLDLGAEELTSAVPFGDDLYLALRDGDIDGVSYGRC